MFPKHLRPESTARVKLDENTEQRECEVAAEAAARGTSAQSQISDPSRRTRRVFAPASCLLPSSSTPIPLHITKTMLQSSTIARTLDGVQTDVLIQTFADRIIVLVTQLGKVGSLVSIA